MSERNPKPCPGECGHTDAEHRAWDSGFKAGAQGVKREDYYYRDPVLVDAWQWGWDSGRWDYKGDEDENLA